MSHLPPLEPPLLAASSRRIGVVLLAFFSLVWAWFIMMYLSGHDPWYRNTDMNAHNIADALCLNAGLSVGNVDQPAAPTKFLLAFDFRIRNALGLLPVWQIKRFSRSPEPLREFSGLVRVARVHSRILVMLLTICAAGFVGHATRRLDAACLTVILLCGSSGLLFHGLLIRPELLCTAFGGVLAPYCVWLSGQTTRPWLRTLWLLLAGIAAGLALLTKLPALFYILLLMAWCCLIPLLRPSVEDSMPSAVLTLAASLGAGAGILGMLLLISPQEGLLDSVAVARLRFAALAIALLPLVSYFAAPTKVGRYLGARVLELSALLAGLLGTLPCWLGLLRTILPAQPAAEYMAKVLNVVFFPDPLVQLFTHAGTAHRVHEIQRFFMETPALFVATVVLVAVLICMQSIPRSSRALASLFLAQGLGMVVMMSKRQFTDQYTIFAQVPLLMVWPIGLAALLDWWRDRAPIIEQYWPVALVASSAMILVLSMPLALASKYYSYQDDATLPVNDLTVTFLYDHEAHPPAYLEAMRRQYTTRKDFVQALDLYLRDPANR